MKAVARVTGPLLALLIAGLVEIPDYPRAAAMLGIAAWMALWWMSECVPLAVTALLPLVAFPLAGISTAADTAPRYMTSIMFLFVGGFLIAQALEESGLHRRIALFVLTRLHAGPLQLLIGFGVATAFLSMWISNTATAMLMVTIGIAVVRRLDQALDATVMSTVAPAIFLMIAYSANLGGMATPVGTVPNLVFLEMMQTFSPGQSLTFVQWMLVGVPTLVVGLIVVFFVLGRRLRATQWSSGVTAGLDDEAHVLGPMSRQERFVAVVLFVTAVLWITRQGISANSFTLPGWAELLPHSGIDDGTVAMAAALCLFLVPVRAGRPILAADAIGKLPWGILVLLGGGFALAMGMQQSGLSEWLGYQLAFLTTVPLILMLLGLALSVTFLTEITSNTATTQVLLPILAAVALAGGHDLTMLMVVATLSASCAFMLPVATPPNAIVFGTQRVALQEMLNAGLRLNFLMALVIVGVVVLMRPLLP